MNALKQWRFTPEGLETAKPLESFVIPSVNFTELTERDGQPVYEWPMKVAETTSLDIEEFIACYAEALKRYEGAYAPQADQAILSRTFDKARRARRPPPEPGIP
jgi:hypothetical protein